MKKKQYRLINGLMRLNTALKSPKLIREGIIHDSRELRCCSGFEIEVPPNVVNPVSFVISEKSAKKLINWMYRLATENGLTVLRKVYVKMGSK